MLANKPDAATHWHLGPGTASMFSAWLGILTPASEGDKNREERAGRSGEVGLRMVSGSFSYLGLRASPDKRLLGKGPQELPWKGEVETGAALAPGKWGWLMLQETAAAGSLLPQPR